MKTMKHQNAMKDRRKPAAAPASAYDAFKAFEGQRYTGMRIGRSHKWYYQKGEWKEKKITPDEWEFTYEVPKRRAGKAPEGSGVPVGTEYHWYILAHQTVRKLNANDYSTSMTGLFRCATMPALPSNWSSRPSLTNKGSLTERNARLRRTSGNTNEKGGCAQPETVVRGKMLLTGPQLREPTPATALTAIFLFNQSRSALAFGAAPLLGARSQFLMVWVGWSGQFVIRHGSAPPRGLL